MKVTLNVECTPLEARQFFGLPDVEPMQQVMMDLVQKRMMKELENYTPERFFEAWSPIMNVNSDFMRMVFNAFLHNGGAQSSPTAMKK